MVEHERKTREDGGYRRHQAAARIGDGSVRLMASPRRIDRPATESYSTPTSTPYLRRICIYQAYSAAPVGYATAAGDGPLHSAIRCGAGQPHDCDRKHDVRFRWCFGMSTGLPSAGELGFECLTTTSTASGVGQIASVTRARVDFPPSLLTAHHGLDVVHTPLQTGVCVSVSSLAASHDQSFKLPPDDPLSPLSSTEEAGRSHSGSRAAPLPFIRRLQDRKRAPERAWGMTSPHQP